MTVYSWMNEFKRSRTHPHVMHSGCPIEAVTPEIIARVHDIVLIDE